MLLARLKTLFPWLCYVDRKSWSGDLTAGLLGAVLALPQGVAFATLAGLPPQYGVYGAVVPCIIAALAGSSRHVITGPTNANSLALVAALAPLALVGSPHYIDLALTVTIMVGLLQLLVGGLRLGAAANFISPSVLLGFMSGAAVLIGLYSLRDFFGIPTAGQVSPYTLLMTLVFEPQRIMWPPLLIGVATLVATVSISRWRPRWPCMLLGLLAGCVIAALLDFWPSITHSIATVSRIPSALPPLRIPNVTWADLSSLSGIAAALTLVALGQSLSIAKAVAQRSGQRIDVNREFIGQGLANGIGGFFSSYVSCGSLNRSMPNFEAGAKTPLAAIFAALFLVVMVTFGSRLIACIPLAAISAMLLLVAWRLIEVKRWRRVLQTSRTETLVATVTFIATLTLPLDRAVLLGTLVSLVAYLYRTSHPAVRVLRPDPRDRARRFTPLEDLPPELRVECPQLKLVRIEGSIFFGATQHVGDYLQRFRSQNSEQKQVLFMTKSMNFIDLAGNDLWEQELRERRKVAGDLYFHRPRTPVVDVFTQTGMLEQLGPQHIFDSKDQALRTIYPQLDARRCQDCQLEIFTECRARQHPERPNAAHDHAALIAKR